ncbi:MAG: zinc protease [Blastocatellia bacterium]|jgi:zinc protease|nr:zinc protease [Blastocatellia bacterium]
MNERTIFQQIIRAGLTAMLLCVLLLKMSANGFGQTTPQPRREQLLNGLAIQMWYRPSDPYVMLKLRVHSGAIFDLTGKAGTMAMLSDALFPDPATREYFTDELGGRLEVNSDYETLNIALTGRVESFERIVELLRTALVNTPLTVETVNSLRDARIKLSREMGISPALLADRAIAARLFGDYPYGRASSGTPDTLARIDRPDLMLARERFLNPNNSTLIIVGGVDEKRVLRTLRQLLGNWRRSDSVVPATFRQPDAPDTRPLIIDLPGAPAVEVRLAVRGLARSDNDAAAAQLLSLLARDRWQAALPELVKSPFFVRQEAHLLPGAFVLGASVSTSQAVNAVTSARAVLKSLATSSPAPAELEKARNEALAVFNKQLDDPATLANLWLDIETFKLPSIDEQQRAFARVTPADIQRVAAKLFPDASIATVAVGGATQLSTDLQRMGKVEIFGAAPAPETKKQAQPSRTP